ncbi:MAG: hypothetical protein GXP55_19990 [Deltaproteobacteria bacterium]|nr:hypothetical protein [Deltaproteobacteria bacterium]
MKCALGISVLCLPLVLACGGGNTPACFEGPSVDLDMRAQTALPWNAPRPVVSAEVCVEAPFDCGCFPVDSNGFATLPLPPDAEVTTVIRADGYVPNLGLVATGTRDFSLAVRLSRTDEFDFVFASLGLTMDASAGHVGVGLLPATGGDASGAIMVLSRLSDGATYDPTYFVARVPAPAATATDADGLALFFNVPPGRYELSSTALTGCGAVETGLPRMDADGALRAIEVEVRAGMISAVSAVQCGR